MQIGMTNTPTAPQADTNVAAGVSLQPDLLGIVEKPHMRLRASLHTVSTAKTDEIAAKARTESAHHLFELYRLATAWETLAHVTLTPRSLGANNRDTTGKRYEGLPERRFAGGHKTGTGISISN